MESHTEGEVEKHDGDGQLEFIDEDADKSRLEDIRVEEEEENHDDRKYDAHILDAKNKITMVRKPKKISET